MAERKVAIVGASGVVGRALLERSPAAGDESVGLSRRPPADLEAPFVPLDLITN